VTAVRALGAVLLSTAVTGCSLGDGSDQPSALTVVEGDPSSVRTAIIGASRRQERVLREILAGIGGTPIRRITVKGAGKDFRPHPAGAVGVVFRYRDDFEAYWHSWIVGQAFVDRSQREALPSVVYVATKGEASRVAPSRATPAPPLSPDERVRLTDSLTAAAERAGAELRSVEVLRPDGTAIAISVRVDDPARFLYQRYHILEERAARLVPRFPGGLMLSVRDAEGRVVRSGFNIGSLGASQVADKYRGCTSLGLSTPLHYRPPPCPLEG
jgi:hypothetical protein